MKQPGTNRVTVQVVEFQPADTMENYFTGAFKHFTQEREEAIRKHSFTLILEEVNS